MTLRRGFKTECNWYSRVYRKELGIEAHAPMCPYRLAEHLDLKIHPLSEFKKEHPEEVRHLTSIENRNNFSATTICHSMGWKILHNDAHPAGRQTSNLMHELAHCILMHKPLPLFQASGARVYDATQEEEANWLGPALIVSDEAAMSIVRLGLSISEAASLYNASVDVVRMRINVTGAMKRAA